MKKIKLLSISLLALLLISCKNQEVKEFTIGVNQFAQHPALDRVREGFEEGLKEEGIDADILYQNAQGEIPNATTISQKFVSDGVDLIFAIATPSAQVSKQITEDIPIIFSAVTDPLEAELVDSLDKPGRNVTGTSDMSPLKDQLSLFKEIDPSIEKVGIVYSTGEVNSKIQVDMATEIGKTLGLEILPMGISTINDMAQTIDSMATKVDGIYTITDNMVANSINIVAEKALENKLVTVGSEQAHVDGGILITKGISYKQLGRQSAQMAKKILKDGLDPKDIGVEVSDLIEKSVNMDSLKALGLDENSQVFN